MPWRDLRACIAERGNVPRFKRFDRKVSESVLQYCRILGVILGRALGKRVSLDPTRAHHAGEYIEQPGNRVGLAAIEFPGRISLHRFNVIGAEIDPGATQKPRPVSPPMQI